MRLGRTPPLLPWLPLSTHHLTRVTLIATIQSGTRVLCSLPPDCTLRSLGTSTGSWPKLSTTVCRTLHLRRGSARGCPQRHCNPGGPAPQVSPPPPCDPRQTSGGTGPGRLAQEVRAVSDELALGVRSARQPHLPQELPHLVQMLLIDDLPPRPESLVPQPDTSLESEGRLPSGGPPSGLGGSSPCPKRDCAR